jgi:4-amino-4-deoxy-L-arabinose transferase-like glycosyltransferase
MFGSTQLIQRIWKIDIRFVHVRTAFRTLAVLLGALHTYAAVKSQSMNADGISYLDIGDAYFRADWATAINTVWSPLYSWILGLVNFIFKPSMAWEFPAVHLVNFLIFLAALSSFEFMWGNARAVPQISNTHTISESFWWALGYLLFIWTSLSLIEIWAVTPDMLMAVFVFLAAGLVAQIRSGDEKLRVFLRLGLVLGLGYLSKTFMFSTALVFLVVAWLVQQRTSGSAKRTLTAAAVFLVISLPYVTLISNAKGKLTIGESGTVTYVRHVLGIPYPHWQGSPEQHIFPTHPSRVIHRSPAVYEFGEPIGGTYPIAFDPSYWYEGITAQLTSGNLTGSLLASGIHYLELFFQKQGILTACVLVLYCMRQRRKRDSSEILRRWALVIPAVISFGLYALVLVEDRYVGVFVLLFWSDILANIRLPDLPDTSIWMKVVSLVAASGLLANIILFNLDGFTRLIPSVNSSFTEASAPAARPLAVAEALHELGIQQGDKVGVIGYAYDSFWARLARVKIVAEMLEADAMDFWQGDEALQQSVLQAFASSGTKAVIAEYVPDETQLQDWHRVGNSNYYIYRFGK